MGCHFYASLARTRVKPDGDLALGHVRAYCCNSALSSWARANALIVAGLRIDALVEPPPNTVAVKDEHLDPPRWYAVDRARLVPTTFIIKATKPSTDALGF